MKKHYSTTILVAAALLSSCGTQIQMTEAVPAQVNLRRGTSININSSDSDMVDAFRNRILRDGFYTLPTDGSTRFAYLTVRDITTKVDRQTKAATIAATTEVTSGGARLYRERYQVSVPRDYQGHYYVRDACDRYARDVMEDLTPHEKPLYVRVSGNSKNPDIEKGALACKAGNWELGEVHAKQAIQTDPQDPEAYYLMGLIERNKMNYTKSTQYFQKAYSLNTSSKYTTAISKNRSMEINDQHVQQQLQS